MKKTQDLMFFSLNNFVLSYFSLIYFFFQQKRKRNVDYGPHKRMRREKEHPPFQIWSSAGVLRFHWLLMYLMREQIEKHKDLLWHWRGSGSPLWGIISLSLNHCPFSHIYSTTLLLKSLLEGMRGQGQHQVPVNHWVDKVGSLFLTFICSINDWSSLCFLAPPILTQFENNPSGEEGRDYKEIQLREERVVVTLSSCLEAWIFYAPGNRIILQTHWDQWANVLQKKIHEVPAPIQVFVFFLFLLFFPGRKIKMWIGRFCEGVLCIRE